MGGSLRNLRSLLASGERAVFRWTNEITNQTIDYIFYTSKDFECARVLDMPKEPIEPLFMPGWRYPSDHGMICADLMFSPDVLRNAPRHGRRNMAQREYSNRRDSPVMTRLLQEIIDAQDN